MSDFFAPSYWYGGGPDFSGLANAQASQASNNNYFANQGRTMDTVNSYSPWANTPGGFGAQTAAYAGAGAAYGRATGGFGGSYGGGDPGAEAPIMSGFGGGEGRGGSAPSIFDTGATAIPYSDSPPPGSFSPSPNYTGGRDPGLSPLSSYQGTGYNAFDPSIYAPSTGFGVPGSGGRGFAGAQPMFDTGATGVDINSGGGSQFANRFGGWGPNAGSPSEYYTGEQYGGPSQMPPGFATPFSADNPGGALTRQMRSGIGQQAPIMNESWDPGESEDTLTPGDRTAPGRFYGSAFDPAQFQPMGSTFDSSGYGRIGSDMSNFASPSADYNTFQRGASYPWTQQVPGNDPNIMNAVYGAAGRVGVDPAAMAGVIGMESPRWDPTEHNKQGYWGMTQMGKGTFDDAGGRLGGMTWDQYKGAPAEQQISAYPDWLSTGARIPGSGANLVMGGIGSLPPPMQASIMQATQFAPNATDWVNRLGQGDMTTPTTMTNQASALRNDGASRYPSIDSMNNYFDRTMRGPY